MSRHYAEGITVRCSSAQSDSDGAPPERFVWRRRRYRVRTVLQRWIEVGAWWRSGAAADEEYQVWRVEAERDRPQGSGAGHYDLCQHQASGSWFLLRTFD